MSDEDQNQEDGISKSLLKFWKGIDVQIKRMLVGAVLLIVLYFIMSPYQNCMRREKALTQNQFMTPKGEAALDAAKCRRITSW